MTDADGITSDLQVAGSIPAGYEHFRSCSSVAERENISSTLAVMPLHESKGRPLAAGRGECLRDYRQTRSVMDAARREGSNPSLAPVRGGENTYPATPCRPLFTLRRVVRLFRQPVLADFFV